MNKWHLLSVKSGTPDDIKTDFTFTKLTSTILAPNQIFLNKIFFSGKFVQKSTMEFLKENSVNCKYYAAFQHHQTCNRDVDLSLQVREKKVFSSA